MVDQGTRTLRPMADLVSGYDAALFDLDGVVYLGPEPVPGAADGLAALRSRGVQVAFVTNNAGRSPQAVVDHLTHLGIDASLADVVTSAQASARQMAADLSPGAVVYVCGAPALAEEIAAVGLVPVSDLETQPEAVVQGYDPQMSQPRLDLACFAIQRGARWYATNTDATRPTDLGLVPGAGSQIAAVRAAVRVDPVVAGKPFPPLLNETVRRLGATRAIFVGDRIDTDIQGAHAVGMDSLFVFTGAHGKHDLADAAVDGRPTALGWDLQALMAPPRQATLDQTQSRCRSQHAVIDESTGEIRLGTVPASRDEALDAVWAALTLSWQTGADVHQALDQIPQIP